MDSIFKHNTDIYNQEEETAYLFKPDHQLRGDIVIELIREVIKNPKKQKLLSIACSIGVFEEKIIRNLKLMVYGIDGARMALKEAKKRGVITKRGDITNSLPYKDNTFDFVFAGEIIEHLIDVKSFLNEINRILKPGGYVVITTPNLARIDDRIKLLFGKTPRNVNPLHPYLYLHIRLFTYESLKSALKICGFRNPTLKTNIITIEIFNINFKFYSSFLTKLFPAFGGTLIVRAQKN